jgi:hypothetical protein
LAHSLQQLYGRGETTEPAECNERDIRDVFTTPLTADEYRILAEVKYHPGADQIRGWALREKDGHAASGPPRSGLAARHAGWIFAKSAALVVAVAVTLVIILAVITLADDGLHANWR